MSSQGEAFTARPSRDCEDSRASEKYEVILPTLSLGELAENTVIFHADIAGRPYRRDDFKNVLKDHLSARDIAAFGAYQMNHVWMVTTRSVAAKEKLVNLKECCVKGRRCLIFDAQQRIVTVRVHWIPYHIPDDVVRKTFSLYGEPSKVTRETYSDGFFKDVESTTRNFKLTLKEGVKPDSIPHVLKIMSNSVLVAIPGRPPLCLRCRRVGHMRQQCKFPKCKECRRFGHDSESCVRTDADRTREATRQSNEDYMMDDLEANQAANGNATESEGHAENKEAIEETVTDNGRKRIPNNQVHESGKESEIGEIGTGTQMEMVTDNKLGTKVAGEEDKTPEEPYQISLKDAAVSREWKSVIPKRRKVIKPYVPYDPRDRGLSQ
ncbi:uncharacterized protein LOC135400510 [Ornithodoros turicata]|uniref:uncharacterized protein LOC135400510 n=1 Tax=Ornithodoros turicata TaxID=34597 RepID=UPI0031390728